MGSRSERRNERIQRAAAREQGREWKARRKEIRRARRALVWRHRWNLIPVVIAVALFLTAWTSSVLAAFGLSSITHYAAGTVVASAIGWAAAGELPGRFRRRRAVRDLTYAAVATLYAVCYLYATRFLYLPFVSGAFEQFAGLFLVGLFGWLPIAVPYWRHHRIRRLRGMQAEYDAWPRRAELVGWPGADLRRVKYLYDENDAYRGRLLTVRLCPGQSLETFSRAAAKTAFNVPTGGTVKPDYVGKLRDAQDSVTTYRDVQVEIIERNPWKDKTAKVEHPLVVNLPELEKHLKAIAAGAVEVPELSKEAKGWLPNTRTIHDPVVVAMSPLGVPYCITLWHPAHGALSMLIGGAAGSGKGVFLNNLIAGLAACRDTWVCLIDTSKKVGRDGRQWGKAIDKLITTKAEAIAYLEAALEAQTNRSIFHTDPTNPDPQKIHIPTPDAPLIVFIIDEGASSFNDDKDPDGSWRMAELVTKIAEVGRSDGILAVVAAQRPSNGDLGGQSKMKVNLPTRIQLPVNTKTDATEVLDHNYQNVEVPVADQVPQGTFVAVDYVHGVSEALQRTCTIDDYRLINRIAALYGGSRRGLSTDHVATRGAAAILAGKTPTPVPNQRKTSSAATPAAPTREEDHDMPSAFDLPVEPAAADSRTQSREKLEATKAGLADLRADFAKQAADPAGYDDVPLSVVLAGHVAPPVPDMPGDERVRKIMLDKLADGPKSRGDMVEAIKHWNAENPDQKLPDSPTTTFRVLQQLRDDLKLIRLDGLGQGALWSLTSPADAEPVDVDA